MHQVAGWTAVYFVGCNDAKSDPIVIQSVTAKRAEILRQIQAYEAQIAHAKHDLAHLNATMELFAAPERERTRHLVSHGYF